jgi:hypothetical protein
MDLDHVFAKATASADDLGYPVSVQGGSCWFADDPLVLARPDLFTTDCRYAIGRDHSWSGDPPAIMAVPPGEEDPVMTAKVRARSQAERARAASR